jgi:glycosyltransferase involved in cell wall biosynthesis
MKPLNILHVLRSPRAEGTVKLTLDWLPEAGFRQEVFVLHPAPAEMTESLKACASWYGQGSGLPTGWAKYPWMVSQVRKVCIERRPDLVICWTNGFSPWVLGGAWLAGVSKLITHAGNPPNWSLWGKAQTMVSTFVTWLTGGRMVCCSHYVADQFARSPAAFGSVLRVVHNCAPVVSIGDAAAAARAQRADDRPRLIMVATLEPHKDHPTLLKAMPAVIRAVPAVQLWLAGEGALRHELQDLCASLGVSGSVVFLGSRRDVPALLGQSDVFVFSTTREEGLGTVLIEALAAGLPIVASDVPACREALADGNWGTLVPAADPAALAVALIANLQTRASVEPEGRREYLQQFSPPGMIAAYVATVS